uniref:C2H2-type domain-containing protein n=1 Tax=Plectus sambesii TaxID=2011161 RepID=A0A914XGI7_9BILA
LPPAGVQLPTPHGLIGVHAPSPQLLAPPPLAGHLPRGNLRHTPSPEAGPGGAPGPMKAQMWRRSRSESDVSGNYVCQHCGQAFSLHDRLAKHIASRHRDRSASVAAGEDCPSKSHKCNVCHKSFGRSDMLTRHMRLHTGLKPYGCHICGQVFSRSDHLSTHQRTHTGEKPYQCPQCSYAASRRDMITRHMRTHSRSGGVGGGPLGPDYGTALPLASLSLSGGHCSPTDLLRPSPSSVLSVVSEHQQLSISNSSAERRLGSSGCDGQMELQCSSSPSSRDPS